uniref:Uncharacterized protein n=1 Tax=Meloidogyne incognita TaxID=6306 RepID=A0A914L218_MELIC
MVGIGRFGKKYAPAKNKSLLNRVVQRLLLEASAHKIYSNLFFWFNCYQLQSRNSNDWYFVRGCLDFE